MCTHSVSHAHFSDTFSLRGVQTSSARITLSILMFHPPSLLFPHGHFDSSFPSAPSLPNCSRSESAGLAHLPHARRGVWLPGHSYQFAGYEPKEVDKSTSADGDTTLVNDPHYGNISDFQKITRENTGLFGVSTMLEASVSHVFHGESKDSMHRETVARQRERRKRRFCDQCCRVDVKEKSTEQY